MSAYLQVAPSDHECHLTGFSLRSESSRPCCSRGVSGRSIRRKTTHLYVHAAAPTPGAILGERSLKEGSKGVVHVAFMAVQGTATVLIGQGRKVAFCTTQRLQDFQGLKHPGVDDTMFICEEDVPPVGLWSFPGTRRRSWVRVKA